MTSPLISIVDDDDLFRRATEALVRSLGFRAWSFESAESFLRSPLVEETRCLILDIQMPKMSGLDLQDHMSTAGLQIPIIFITGHPDEALKARALSAGAICFLSKSVDLRGPRLAHWLQIALNQPRT